MSDWKVSGFNGCARLLSGAAEMLGSREFYKGLNLVKGELSTPDGIKGYIVKPLTAISPVLSYFKATMQYPGLDRLATDATTVKAFLSGLEVITKLPSCMDAVLSPIKGSLPARSYFVFNEKDGKKETESAQKVVLTEGEVVFKRLFVVAGWVIAVADSISLFKKYHAINSRVENSLAWIYSIAGGYMGAQSLYEESRVVRETGAAAPITEKAYQALNLLTSAAYIGQGVVGGLNIYHKGNRPAWLVKAQLLTSFGGAVLPAVQKIAGIYLGNVKPKTA